MILTSIWFIPIFFHILFNSCSSYSTPKIPHTPWCDKAHLCCFALSSPPTSGTLPVSSTEVIVAPSNEKRTLRPPESHQSLDQLTNFVDFVFKCEGNRLMLTHMCTFLAPWKTATMPFVTGRSISLWQEHISIACVFSRMCHGAKATSVFLNIKTLATRECEGMGESWKHCGQRQKVSPKRPPSVWVHGHGISRRDEHIRIESRARAAWAVGSGK